MSTIIPFVIFDAMANDTIIEYNSVSEEDLYMTLINHIKILMQKHEFVYTDDSNDDCNDDDDDGYDNGYKTKYLTCSECECLVVSKIYITNIDGKNFCGGCNPNPNDNIVVNKKTYDKFMEFLHDNNENCDIIYFKDDTWFDFIVS